MASLPSKSRQRVLIRHPPVSALGLAPKDIQEDGPIYDTAQQENIFLGPLKWKRTIGLVAGQSLLGGVAAGIAFFAFGSPYRAVAASGSTFLSEGILRTMAIGTAAALPLLAFVAVEELLDLKTRFPALDAVGNTTKATVLIALGNVRAPVSACMASLLIALAAGFGEELLFRGVLQRGLSAQLDSGPAGLIIASAIFGALHAATPTYALLAGVAGLYFGWLFNTFDSSIIVPAVAHTLYDWVALMLVHFEVTQPGTTGDMQLEILDQTNRKQ